MRRYMECQRIYQLYTVSQIVTTPLDYFSTNQHYTFARWRLAVDDNDFVVPAHRTIALQKLFKNSQLLRHNQGK